MTQNSFDPAQYKATTQRQWDNAAEAWHRWGPALRTWLGPATEKMLELAGVEPGSRVLDIAAGAGDQTLQIARRVGAGGSVLATDLSQQILTFADAEARRAGLTNVRTRAMDGEQLELPDTSFDVIVSRLGLIYFPDQSRALSEMRRVLVPGGKVAAIVYSTADRNAFFSVPVAIIRRHAGLGAPQPGQPGPFSLGAPGAIEAAFERAGFSDVNAVRIPAPLRLSSAAECLRFERESFGALHQMLSALDANAQERAWDEVGSALREQEHGPDEFVGPCELVIAVGTRSA